MNLSIYVKSSDGSYKELDLYDDESIIIKQTLKGVRDVDKVSSDSTRRFKVPASKRNNVIFQHYYDNNIVDGFDARYRADCLLKMDGVDFKEGEIRLDNVSMENGSPSSYSIVFLGKASSLKNIIGDDKLDEISELNSFTHTMNFSNIRKYSSRGANLTYSGSVSNGLTDGSSNAYESPDLIYPFISSKDRYFLDSDEATPNIEGNRNLYNDTISTVNDFRGLNYKDLKPAIKPIRIMEMIARKYGLQFSDDFLNDDSRTVMNSLYMWFSRESGRAEKQVNKLAETFSEGVKQTKRNIKWHKK